MNVGLAADYTPHDKQRLIHRSNKRFVTIIAGARSGKTYSACVEFVLRIYKDLAAGKGNPQASARYSKRGRPKLHYWVVSPTFALLKEPMRYILSLVPLSLWEGGYRGWYEAEKMLFLKGNILIEFKSAEDPEKLVASGIDGMLLDEVCRIKRDAWEGQLRMRLSDRQGWALFCSTPLGFDWVWSELYQRGVSASLNYDSQYESFKFFTADNPYIPREEIEHARRTLPPKYFKREYEADFASFSGLIFDEFHPDIHIITEQQLRKEYNLGTKPLGTVFSQVVAGMDFGYTSPGAIVVVGVIGNSSQYIVLNESYKAERLFYSDNKNEDTWVGEAAKLQKFYNIKSIYCDTADPERILQLSRHGIAATGAVKDVANGIRNIAESLHPIDGKPKLRILSDCKNLSRELGRYVYAEDRSGNRTEEPAPNQEDHAVDALRYALMAVNRHAPSPYASYNPGRGPMY